MKALAELLLKKKAVMGVLNLTPDSFSDGNQFMDPACALEHVLKMQEEGMDLLDVGAESSRPGAEEVDEREQLRRLEVFFEKVLPHVKVPVSIDTRHSTVARIAVEAGVSIINDVSALTYDIEGMLSVLHSSEVFYVLMHSRGTPKDMTEHTQYKDLLEELKLFFEEKLAFLKQQGLSLERFFLDPGIGFAKTAGQSLSVLSNLNCLGIFRRPILVGLSRKSFLKPFFGMENRAMGTELAHWIALEQGAQILRVHEVKAARQTIRFFDEYKMERLSKGVGYGA